MIRHADPVLMNVFRMLHGYSPDPDCPNDTVGADIVCSWDGRRFCGDEKKTELALAALSIIATDPDTMQLTTLRLGCTLNATGMLVRERFLPVLLRIYQDGVHVRAQARDRDHRRAAGYLFRRVLERDLRLRFEAQAGAVELLRRPGARQDAGRAMRLPAGAESLETGYADPRSIEPGKAHVPIRVGRGRLDRLAVLEGHDHVSRERFMRTIGSAL